MTSNVYRFEDRVFDPAVPLHPIVSAAASGDLPPWAVAGPERRGHLTRVAALLGAWAEELGLDETDRVRWRAAGHLHDVLRDEEPDRLRPRVPVAEQCLPGPLLHGPAAAERLRIEGVEDGPLLTAIAWHTVGDPRFGRLGRALFAADFLEPGRTFLPDWRAALRARMPGELDGVTREVARARLTHVLERGRPLLARSTEFWNRLVEDAG